MEEEIEEKKEKEKIEREGVMKAKQRGRESKKSGREPLP